MKMKTIISLTGNESKNVTVTAGATFRIFSYLLCLILRLKQTRAE